MEWRGGSFTARIVRTKNFVLCTRCGTAMQSKNVPRHSRRWCRATYAVALRHQSGLRKLHAAREYIAYNTPVTMVRGVAGVLGHHLEKNSDVKVEWCFWVEAWVDLVLKITGGAVGRHARVKRTAWNRERRVAAMRAVQADPELRELLVPALKLGGNQAARDLIKEAIA